jgi:hypothetical protein
MLIKSFTTVSSGTIVSNSGALGASAVAVSRRTASFVMSETRIV